MALKEEILKHLTDGPKTVEELMVLTGKGNANVQARVSDLRKDGYNIELKPIEVRKYVLVSKDNSVKLMDFIAENDLYNVSISLPKLATKINMSLDDIKVAIGKLFSIHKIIQYDKDTVAFIRP